MLSPFGIKLVGGLLVTGLGLLYARKFIQGYWWDKYCTSRKDLTGQTVLVTGGNSGVGYETALDLAGRNASVIIACRSEQRAKQAVAEITRRTPNRRGEVTYALLDLSDFRSVTRFLDEFRQRHQSLHILVNNAGIGAGNGQTTPDGHNTVWQTNYLAPFYLTNQLLPLLKSSGTQENPSRIVFVASGAHKRATINWDNTSEPKGEYGQSKLAQIMQARQLQTRLDEEKAPVQAVSCTPGFTRTAIFDNAIAQRWHLRLVYYLLFPLVLCLSRSQYVGAQCLIHCCVSEPIHGGGYYSNCVEKPTDGKDGIANDSEAWKRLWELSESQLEKIEVLQEVEKRQ